MFIFDKESEPEQARALALPLAPVPRVGKAWRQSQKKAKIDLEQRHSQPTAICPDLMKLFVPAPHSAPCGAREIQTFNSSRKTAWSWRDSSMG